MTEPRRQILKIEDEPWPTNRAMPHCIACEAEGLARLVRHAEEYWDGENGWASYSTPTLYKCLQCGKKTKSALWIDHEEWKPDDERTLID